MKEYWEVFAVYCNEMTEKDREYLEDAEYDRDDENPDVAREGLKRLTRRIAKYGLTLKEWDNMNMVIS